MINKIKININTENLLKTFELCINGKKKKFYSTLLNDEAPSKIDIDEKKGRLGDDKSEEKKTIVYELKVDDTQLKEALENITNKIEKVTDQQLRLKCLDIVSKDKEVPVLAYKVHADALFNYIKEEL